MIDIDPKLHLPDDYVVSWTCPRCANSAQVALGQLEKARCVACQEDLSPDDRESLDAFRKLIA